MKDLCKDEGTEAISKGTSWIAFGWPDLAIGGLAGS